MKFRLPVAILVMAVLSAGNCLWLPASHACCQKPPAVSLMPSCPGHSQEPALCCVIQPVAAPAAHLITGFWTPEHPAALFQTPLLHRIMPEPAKSLALQHQAFIKNQSRRYLELGILLS